MRSRNVFCSLRQICDCPIKTDLRQSDLQLIIAGVGPSQPQVVGDGTAK
jgi:hypothetical protein